MRKYLVLEERVNKIKKVMIYETDEEAYVFLYDTHEDKPCFADYWFESVEDAEDYCEAHINVKEKNWLVIDDPKAGCQHDLIECK
ncbi:hypothetical protein [Paenibacillus paridis]|uniref:hypothetical protein n=1 Tax=Paenibacillus paridis TaxID=2583376 RepID=UPI001122B90E|nr:hypothetical protein [Paenibacillus paridis]